MLRWDWDWDRELLHGSGGAFYPGLAAKLRRPEKPTPTSLEECFQARVSVVCPTTDSRHEFHEQLWAVFDAQAWPDKELVVVETYTNRPSAFFTEKKKTDNRLVYVAFKVQPESDWSIGLKRNMCTYLSTGAFMANFDDDDLYAPNYLDVMIRSMLDQKSEGITLSAYYVFDVRSGKFGWCDQRYASESTRYGFGFSYVFLRGAAWHNPYPNQNMGEDFCFFNALRKRQRPTVFGGQRQVALHVDESGICCHTLHPKATSNTYAKRQVPIEEVEGLYINELEDLLSDYMSRFPQTQGFSHFIGKSAHREQKVTVHSTVGDYQFTCKMGTPMSELLELLHEQLQCGGSPSEVHLHSSCPPCLEQKDGKLQAVEIPEPAVQVGDPPPDGDTSPVEEARAKAVLGAPSLAATDRVGPRRAELWATLPTERCEEPSVEVTVRDIRNQDVSVVVRVHSIERLAGVRRAVIRQHGSRSEAARRLARELRLAQRHVREGVQEPSKGARFEACDPGCWLLGRRELFAPGLQPLLDQVALEQGRGPPVIRLYAEDCEEGFMLVEVPLPATARELRGALGGRLPDDAQLFPGCLPRGPGRGDPDSLEEDVRLPTIVTADRFNGSVMDSIFASRDMAVQAQQWCIEQLSKEETQQLFNTLEADSDGDFNTYRKRMFDSLTDSVYVPVLEGYGLPVDRRGVMMLSTSIQAHFTGLDYTMTENWLRVELLMRNRIGAKAAEAALGRVYVQLQQSGAGP